MYSTLPYNNQVPSSLALQQVMAAQHSQTSTSVSSSGLSVKTQALNGVFILEPTSKDRFFLWKLKMKTMLSGADCNIAIEKQQGEFIDEMIRRFGVKQKDKIEKKVEEFVKKAKQAHYLIVANVSNSLQLTLQDPTVVKNSHNVTPAKVLGNTQKDKNIDVNAEDDNEEDDQIYASNLGTLFDEQIRGGSVERSTPRAVTELNSKEIQLKEEVQFDYPEPALSAKDVWDYLELRFGGLSGGLLDLQKLQHKFTNQHMLPNEDVSDFMNELDTIRTRINASGHKEIHITDEQLTLKLMTNLPDTPEWINVVQFLDSMKLQLAANNLRMKSDFVRTRLLQERTRQENNGQYFKKWTTKLSPKASDGNSSRRRDDSNTNHHYRSSRENGSALITQFNGKQQKNVSRAAKELNAHAFYTQKISGSSTNHTSAEPNQNQRHGWGNKYNRGRGRGGYSSNHGKFNTHDTKHRGESKQNKVPGNNYRCHKCNKEGHFIRHCPLWKDQGGSLKAEANVMQQHSTSMSADPHVMPAVIQESADMVPSEAYAFITVTAEKNKRNSTCSGYLTQSNSDDYDNCDDHDISIKFEDDSSDSCSDNEEMKDDRQWWTATIERDFNSNSNHRQLQEKQRCYYQVTENQRSTNKRSRKPFDRVAALDRKRQRQEKSTNPIGYPHPASQEEELYGQSDIIPLQAFYVSDRLNAPLLESEEPLKNLATDADNTLIDEELHKTLQACLNPRYSIAELNDLEKELDNYARRHITVPIKVEQVNSNVSDTETDEDAFKPTSFRNHVDIAQFESNVIKNLKANVSKLPLTAHENNEDCPHEFQNQIENLDELYDEELLSILTSSAQSNNKQNSASCHYSTVDAGGVAVNLDEKDENNTLDTREMRLSPWENVAHCFMVTTRSASKNSPAPTSEKSENVYRTPERLPGTSGKSISSDKDDKNLSKESEKYGHIMSNGWHIWGIDSACTNHITNDLTVYANDYVMFPQGQERRISVGNGAVILGIGQGTAIIQTGKGKKPIALHKTLYCPAITRNLISVGLATQRGIAFVFTNKGCDVVEASSKRTIVKAIEKDGLYLITSPIPIKQQLKFDPDEQKTEEEAHTASVTKKFMCNKHS